MTRRKERAGKPQTHYFGILKGQPKHVPDASKVSAYALDKARRLTCEQFEAAGLGALAKEYETKSVVTNPMIALASYIDRME